MKCIFYDWFGCRNKDKTLYRKSSQFYCHLVFHLSFFLFFLFCFGVVIIDGLFILVSYTALVSCVHTCNTHTDKIRCIAIKFIKKKKSCIKNDTAKMWHKMDYYTSFGWGYSASSVHNGDYMELLTLYCCVVHFVHVYNRAMNKSVPP